MIRYDINSVEEGMILGRSIFMPSGELLLAAGYKLRSNNIKRLKHYGFDEIFVEEEGTEGVEPPESIISNHVKRETFHAVEENAEQLKSEIDVAKLKKASEKDIKKLIYTDSHKFGKFLAKPRVMQSIEKTIEQIFTNRSLVLNIETMQKKDGNLFTDAISGTVTALTIGKIFRFNKEELFHLGVGALNRDLGCIAIPDEIIKKNSPLSSDEMEIYRRHPVYGYLMLKSNPSITPTSTAIALQHHEAQNGKGYPRGMKGDNQPPKKDFHKENRINRFAEITAVADTYDSFIKGYFGEKMNALDAVKRLVELSGSTLNRTIVNEFIKIIPVYPVGTMVEIKDAPSSQLMGYKGVIAKENPNDLEKPLVIIFKDSKGRKIKPFRVDLSVHSNVEISIFS